MKGLFRTSLEECLPIDIMYISNKGEITHRNIIVKDIQTEYIRAFDIGKRQPRLFKLTNILSAAKQSKRKGVKYA
ncbi:hypothetical protein [Metabacillus litoralis]|uniref:hypothetical protein n=1 Tax=Metabacillus litoralis TaxID=152268 RepID=UPI0020421EDB|nr:hypothetical protein [Metabacillus litoralis]MCM3413499.1 hypothetical protein [Metabacillus litoralis]